MLKLEIKFNDAQMRAEHKYAPEAIYAALTDLYDRTKDIKLAQSAAGHTTPTMCLKRYVKGRNNSPRAATAAIDAVYSA